MEALYSLPALRELHLMCNDLRSIDFSLLPSALSADELAAAAQQQAVAAEREAARQRRIAKRALMGIDGDDDDGEDDLPISSAIGDEQKHADVPQHRSALFPSGSTPDSMKQQIAQAIKTAAAAATGRATPAQPTVSGVLPRLAVFRSLTALDLSFNSLSAESVAALSRLPALTELSLAGNGLTALPLLAFAAPAGSDPSVATGTVAMSVWAGFTKLKKLSLRGNRLGGGVRRSGMGRSGMASTAGSARMQTHAGTAGGSSLPTSMISARNQSQTAGSDPVGNSGAGADATAAGGSPPLGRRVGRGGERKKYPTRIISYSSTMGQPQAQNPPPQQSQQQQQSQQHQQQPPSQPTRSEPPPSGPSESAREAIAAAADYAVWSALAALPAIEDLDLSENRLTSVPDAAITPIGAAPPPEATKSGRPPFGADLLDRPWHRLKYLNLAMNKFDSDLKLIPLSTYPALEWLDLRGNVFNREQNHTSFIAPTGGSNSSGDFPQLYRALVRDARINIVIAQPKPYDQSHIWRAAPRSHSDQNPIAGSGDRRSQLRTRERQFAQSGAGSSASERVGGKSSGKGSSAPPPQRLSTDDGDGGSDADASEYAGSDATGESEHDRFARMEREMAERDRQMFADLLGSSTVSSAAAATGAIASSGRGGKNSAAPTAVPERLEAVGGAGKGKGTALTGDDTFLTSHGLPTDYFDGDDPSDIGGGGSGGAGGTAIVLSARAEPEKTESEAPDLTAATVIRAAPNRAAAIRTTRNLKSVPTACSLLFRCCFRISLDPDCFLCVLMGVVLW